MKKKKYIILSIVLISIVFIGIYIAISKVNANEVIEEEVNIYFMADTYLDSGILFNESGLIKFTDIKTRHTTALCDKPSCKHNTDECNAFVGQTDLLAIYNGKLYFVQSIEGEKTFSKYLFQADINGGNRKRVAEIDNISWIAKAKFTKGKLILNTMQNVNKETFMALEKPITSLISIDLESYNIDYIVKSDKLSGNIRDFEYIKEDNKILYNLEYIDLPKIFLEDGTMIEESEIEKSFVFELCEYNLDTKEIKQLKKSKGEYVNSLVNEKALIVDFGNYKKTHDESIYSGYIYNCKDNSKKEIDIVSKSKNPENGKAIVAFVPGNTGYSNTYYYFDENKCRFNKIVNLDDSYPVGISSKYFYFYMKNEKGENWVYALEMKDFLKGNLSSAKQMKLQPIYGQEVKGE